jgi:type I restriction enzyme M protein
MLENEVVDVAICNPPYLKVNKTKDHNELFDNVGLKACKRLRTLSTDLIFLAQNLNLLRHGGEMGIIVPDGLITSIDYLKFRESLISNHNLKGVISLPEKIFKKTEAKTHILIIEKGTPSNSSIPLYKSDLQGQLSPNLKVGVNDLVKRMDYGHYDWKRGVDKLIPYMPLGSLVESITRGSLSYKQLRESSYQFLHTTNMSDKMAISGNNIDCIGNMISVKSGDIILARVGRNCIGKVSIIESGEFIISDCLYRIRPKKGYALTIWESLKTEYAKSWLKGYSHGVCAKVISKSDLLNYPVMW